MVGDGKHIHVFEDAWLRQKSNFKVDTIRTENNGIVRVCDLFIPGVREWDIQKVLNSFQNCDVKAILATPIPHRQVCDRITWLISSYGKYNVKSG